MEDGATEVEPDVPTNPTLLIYTPVACEDVHVRVVLCP